MTFTPHFLLFFSMLIIGSLLWSLFLSKISFHLLIKYKILAHPCPKSNHALPTPRGGGVALIFTFILFFPLLAYFPLGFSVSDLPIQLWLGGLMLAAISFVDDIKNISIQWRFFIQIIAVLMGLDVIGDEGFIFQGLLPWGWDRALGAFLWVWFINLYNFIDGMDGLIGMQTLCITCGLIVITLLTHSSMDITYYSCVILGASLGFLRWNFPPAKLFAGDVGSISLGFFLGGILLTLAIRGYWVAATILPLYAVADTSITLGLRLIRGKKIWEGHSEHFFQQALRKGKSHKEVLFIIVKIQIGLMLLAIGSVTLPLSCYFFLGSAFFIVGSLLMYLKKR